MSPHTTMPGSGRNKKSVLLSWLSESQWQSVALCSLLLLPVAAVPQLLLVIEWAPADFLGGDLALKAFGNVLLIACLLMAGRWIWLTSTLHQQRNASVWLMAGVIVIVGMDLRCFFAAGGKA